MRVCIQLCTILVQNSAQNTSDTFILQTIIIPFHSIPLHFIRKRQIASSTKQIYAVKLE